MRDSLVLLLGLEGHRTACFASAEAFLSAYRPGGPGCLLLDVRMPGMSGLELQAELAARGDPIPVIIITGHGDIAMARAALRAGAEDFLEKPIDNTNLLDSLRAALDRDSSRRRLESGKQHIKDRVGRLTERERQVMELAVEGRHNREIGEQLGISPRTVEVYKSRMMEKLQVSGLPELIRLLLESRQGGPLR